MITKSISVAAAIIEQDGRLLIGKRKEGGSLSGYWEFPGGKIQKGESTEECLCRECKEELNVEIGSLTLFFQTEHLYAEEEFSVRLSFYKAQIREGLPVCLAHSELVWVNRNELSRYSFCPANKEVLERLKEETQKGNGAS